VELAALSLTSLKYSIPTAALVTLSLGLESDCGKPVPPSIFVLHCSVTSLMVNVAANSPFADSPIRLDMNAIPPSTRTFLRAVRGVRHLISDYEKDAVLDGQDFTQDDAKGEDQSGLPPHP
jgi:hypothetical protein